MSESEIIVLAGGAALLALFGGFHMGGLRLIGWCTPERRDHPHLSVIATFWGLGFLHLAEIALGALVLWLLLLLPGTGSLGNASEVMPADYLYVAGSSFVTLGYAQVDAHGAIRLLVMLLSLGGFMVLTWSATFIYTMWGEITATSRRMSPRRWALDRTPVLPSAYSYDFLGVVRGRGGA